MGNEITLGKTPTVDANWGCDLYEESIMSEGDRDLGPRNPQPDQLYRLPCTISEEFSAQMVHQPFTDFSGLASKKSGGGLPEI